jgi:hypothetical protein
VTPASAHHGPGTSGGGGTTISGETLDRGRFELAFRLDFTEFDSVGRERVEELSETVGEFDSIERALLGTFSLSYGVTADLQLGAEIGYYTASNFISAGHGHEEEAHDAGHEDVHDDEDSAAGVADPDGLTDLWFNLKYRIVKGEPGSLAVIAGVKLPTGRDDVELDNGERLEPSSQPGTGSWDVRAGLAYSRFLTEALTIDASALYTIRTEHDNFDVGDRFDAGVALAYRLTADEHAFPTFQVFGEALVTWLDKDEHDGETNANSGGTLLFLSPGLRVRFNPSIAFTIAPAFPVAQDLNGEQVEAEFRLTAGLSFTF